jgi:hypothetical protein
MGIVAPSQGEVAYLGMDVHAGDDHRRGSSVKPKWTNSSTGTGCLPPDADHGSRPLSLTLDSMACVTAPRIAAYLWETPHL